MRRCQEHHWRLDPWDVPSLEWIEFYLEKLSYYTGTSIDSVRHLILADDFKPIEIARVRRFQKVFLARYGKQSMMQWDDYPLVEFVRDFDELMDLMNKENPMTIIQE